MKRAISSVLIYALLFGGVISMAYGYYILSIKEIDMYRESIGKSDSYRIETFTGKVFFVNSVDLKKIDQNIYMIINGEKIPVSDIKSVNSSDINSEVIKKASRNGTMGIILAAVGGLSIIISLILKDYI